MTRKIAAEKDAVHDTLKSFAEFGGALLDARDGGEPLDARRARADLEPDIGVPILLPDPGLVLT